MSNQCKTCEQPISWDQKRREALHIRGPCNLDGTIHNCVNRQTVQEVGGKTPQNGQDRIDATSIVKTLEVLTNSVNALVFAICSETELQRVQARAMVSKI